VSGCVLLEEIKLYAPKRKQKKVNMTLTEDTIKFLDDLSGAMGMSRSSFLQIFIDTHNEYMTEFVRGWLASLQIHQERLEEEKRVKEAKKMAEDLGQKTTTRHSH